ncbi:MAG: hypothetical protein OEL83_17160 [Desulforhopalus sp.]|nr:hypothetical protein [Desulforhopalus sp.]
MASLAADPGMPVDDYLPPCPSTMTREVKDIHTFPLGKGLAVLRPGDGRLNILNPLARWIWEHSALGMHRSELESLLTLQAGHDPQAVEDLFSQWAAAGLDPEATVVASQDQPDYATFWLGGRRIRVAADSRELLQAVQPCLGHLVDTGPPGPVAGTIALCHEGDGYAIIKNGTTIRHPASLNDLTVEALWEIVEIGCAVPGRLMTVHGAAVAGGGACCLLAGRGGSGKTTLAAGLAAIGFTLIADDVIPVNSGSGLLSPMPMAMCIKAGSWPALDAFYPAAHNLLSYQRFGKEVRFYPPPPTAIAEPFSMIRANAVVFPHYVRNSQPQLTEVPSHEVLAELVRSNSIIDTWSPKKLAEVAAWVDSLQGYKIVYPDMQTGLDLVRRIFRDHLKFSLPL